MATMMEEVLNKKFSRRDFLKGTVAATAAVAGLGLAGKENNLASAENVAPAEHPEIVNPETGGEWVPAACWHNCGGRCINLALVKDGVVLRQKTDDSHPDSPDYPANCLKWGRRALRSARVRTNGTFGSVMCLCTDWRKKRRESIKEVLSKHAFDGIYYDWCAGLECDNAAHGTGPHWDNEELLEHIKWTVREFARTPERDLHVTYVASLAVENAATMIITEEQGFPDPGPEMFTPHVHFLNVAPRQICSMIRNATPVQLRQEAMAALLHHATVSSLAQPIVDFYASLDFLDEVGEYTRHTAPGEGLAFSSDPEVGVSVYWNDAKALIVAANFSETPKKAELRIALPDKPELEEEIALKPLEVKTIRAELVVEQL